MDRDSRAMLSFIKSDPVCQNGFCLFSDFYDAFEAKTGIDEHRAMACIRFLESSGYIAYCQNQLGQNVGFEFEHKTYHQAYFTFSSIRSFLIKSVLIPIAVSAATSLLTMWLTQL